MFSRGLEVVTQNGSPLGRLDERWINGGRLNVI